MRFANLLSLGLTAGFMAFSALAGDALSVSYQGPGPLTFGMSIAQVNRTMKSHIGVPEVAGIDPTGECFEVEMPGHPGVALMFVHQTLARVDVDTSAAKAFGVVSVGDTADAVAERVAPPVRKEPHFYVKGGWYLTAQSPTADLGIRFEIVDDRVSRFYAGTVEAIHYVEGCS